MYEGSMRNYNDIWRICGKMYQSEDMRESTRVGEVVWGCVRACRGVQGRALNRGQKEGRYHISICRAVHQPVRPAASHMAGKQHSRFLESREERGRLVLRQTFGWGGKRISGVCFGIFRQCRELLLTGICGGMLWISRAGRRRLGVFRHLLGVNI